MLARRGARWVRLAGVLAALAVIAGSVAACSKPEPEPVATARVDCVKPVTSSASEMKEASQTLNAIRYLCNQPIGEHHPAAQKRIKPTASSPGRTSDGCILPSQQEAATPRDLRLCFTLVPAREAQLTSRFPSTDYYVIRLADESGRPSNQGPLNTYAWTYQKGARQAFYFNRPGKFQALLVRTVSQQSPNSVDTAGIQVWCVNQDKVGVLENFGSLDHVADREDQTGAMFRLLRDEFRPYLQRWLQFQMMPQG